MKKSFFRKGASALLAVVMCLSSFLGIGATTAFAAEEVSDTVVMFSFPREGDANFSGNWGHGDLQYMNGWSAGASSKITVYTVGSWSGKACYAGSFEVLFKHVSLNECGFSEEGATVISAASTMEGYYTLAKQKEHGVVGIKFSVDKRRSLSEIEITETEINTFLAKHTDINESKIKEVREWFAWHKENYTLQGLDNLGEIIDLFDSSVELFIDMLTDDLMEKAEESGYRNIEDYLDRPFRAQDFFDLPNWWKTTRSELIRFYCGITV